MREIGISPDLIKQIMPISLFMRWMICINIFTKSHLSMILNTETGRNTRKDSVSGNVSQTCVYEES